jgi:NADH dehydrogenase [ubiquinone] 1 alpha subcomplex assembly factor 7
LTPLERALRDQIRVRGPDHRRSLSWPPATLIITATRDPLGRPGDFTTAPEISQMFGELVGACLADCWAARRQAGGVHYVELGPGRGTLACDALRVMRSAGLEPDVHLVETSPVLREAQAAALPDAQLARRSFQPSGRRRC